MPVSLNGGTEAPTRRRRGIGRGKAVSGGLNPQGRGMMNPPGEDAPGSSQINARGRGRSGTGGKIGLQGAGLPGPGGRQLESRVQSGAITEQQAQKTMSQRQTLAKALGPNWRDKLQVEGQSFAQVNKQLKANPGNAKLAALRKKLLAGRSSSLETAREKIKSGSGEGGE